MATPTPLKKPAARPELRVRGFDRSAPGSYREQVQLLRLLDASSDAEDSGDQRAMVKVGLALFAFIEARAYREDGGDPAELLDLLSAEEMDALARQLAGLMKE